MLLPAFATVEFDEVSRTFFENGGVASLLGCTREEYVSRRMNNARKETETPEDLAAYGDKARSISHDVLIAIDYEIGGVHRLHNLAPQIAHPSVALEMSVSQLESFGRDAAVAAKRLGVNFFLAPVLDIVEGRNPWLLNRTLQAAPSSVGRITSAFIAGVQSQGVAATAKHFPGHRVVASDPYDSHEPVVEGSLDDLMRGIAPFRQAIAMGVDAIMTGPVPVMALDPEEPSSTSRIVVNTLRQDLGFDGLIVSDDLDLLGTLRGRTLENAVVQSLLAGVELLLLAGGEEIHTIAAHIAQATGAGVIPRQTLTAAADKVRSLAQKRSLHT